MKEMNCIVGSAQTLIRDFNNNTNNVAADWIVARCFPEVDTVFDERLMDRMCILNALFRTRLSAMEIVTLEKRIKKSKIAAELRALPNAEPDQRINKALDILELFFSETEAPKHPYSFATKFLHWTTRKHFPIMDSRARSTLRELQECKSWNISKRDKLPKSWNNTDRLVEYKCINPREDYRRWLCVYSTLMAALTDDQKRQLHRFDQLPSPYAIEGGNSLLRIIDKYLYQRNGPPSS